MDKSAVISPWRCILKDRTGKRLSALLIPALLLSLFSLSGEEILNDKRLARDVSKFSISRDIFSPDTMAPPSENLEIKRPTPPPPEIKPPEPKTEEQIVKDSQDEVKRTLFYEGYVIKPPKNFALVSMNGEFYAVGAGDMVLDKFKIIKIDRKTITVEIDSREIEIQLKGDDENDNE